MPEKPDAKDIMQRKLVSADQAETRPSQHTTPCADCPWRRDSLPGWLGDMTPEQWLACAHGETKVMCHCIKNQQCAGVAIYRRNVAKYAYPPNLRLEADREVVFASRAEFAAHHDRRKD